ncbi:MAG: DUF4272 domain-containing protein [Alphaproteobacteria bacterium]|nr:DUF4272 domain-containing protein [Alphaproteobacteria bacterium]
MESSSSKAEDRKRRSEEVLQSEGVPVEPSLPTIESEDEANLRSVEEIAYRALSLIVVAMRAEGMDRQTFQSVVTRYGLSLHLTEAEAAFVGEEKPDPFKLRQFVWGYEAANCLMWALGYVPALGKPERPGELPQVIDPMKRRSTQQFIADAKLRPLSEILDQADLIYRYRWAIIDAFTNEKPEPAGLNADVALERHTAMNWLIGHMGQEWDDVWTDTE